jgi:hypothetical protein
VDTKIINVERLDSTLLQYLPKNTKIDFLTIDVEGLDIQVLKSNDWNKYRPKIVTFEEKKCKTIEEYLNSESHKFMNKINYQFVCKSTLNVFYKDKNTD